MILSVIFRNIFNKISNKLNSCIKNYIEHDLKMQERREKAKINHVVNCPYCGADNMHTKQTGTCEFCKRKLEYKIKERK